METRTYKKDREKTYFDHLMGKVGFVSTVNTRVNDRPEIYLEY